jgi:hypothetical protein
MATFERFSQGIGNSAAYMVSGYPYLTGSTNHLNNQEMEIKFPYVTKRIVIINRADKEIRVHFASKDSTNNVINNLRYITLDTTEDSMDMNVKVDRMYVTGDGSYSGDASFQIFAELTSIPTGSLGRLYATPSTADTDGVGWPGISD